MIVFHLPTAAPDGKHHLEVGMVVSVWKGVKKPRLHSAESHINSVVAFRAISLNIADEDGCFALFCTVLNAVFSFHYMSLIGWIARRGSFTLVPIAAVLEPISTSSTS